MADVEANREDKKKKKEGKASTAKKPAPKTSEAPDKAPKKKKESTVKNKKKVGASISPAPTEQNKEFRIFIGIVFFIVIVLIGNTSDMLGGSSSHLTGTANLKLAGTSQSSVTVFAMCGGECTGDAVRTMVNSLAASGVPKFTVYLLAPEDSEMVPGVEEAIGELSTNAGNVKLALFPPELEVPYEVYPDVLWAFVMREFIKTTMATQKGIRLRNMYIALRSVDVVFQDNPLVMAESFHTFEEEYTPEEPSGLMRWFADSEAPRPDGMLMLVGDQPAEEEEQNLKSFAACAGLPFEAGSPVVHGNVLVAMTMPALIKYMEGVTMTAKDAKSCLVCEGEECSGDESAAISAATTSLRLGVRWVILLGPGDTIFDLGSKDTTAEVTEGGHITNKDSKSTPVVVYGLSSLPELSAHALKTYGGPRDAATAGPGPATPA